MTELGKLWMAVIMLPPLMFWLGMAWNETKWRDKDESKRDVRRRTN